MQKVVIAAFVLLGCVCLIQATNHTTSSTTVPPKPSTTMSVSTGDSSTSVSPGGDHGDGGDKDKKSPSDKPTSGVGTVKGFAGLVMSIFVIALM